MYEVLKMILLYITASKAVSVCIYECPPTLTPSQLLCYQSSFWHVAWNNSKEGLEWVEMYLELSIICWITIRRHKQDDCIVLFNKYTVFLNGNPVTIFSPIIKLLFFYGQGAKEVVTRSELMWRALVSREALTGSWMC